MARGCVFTALGVVLLLFPVITEADEELTISNCDGSPRLVSRVEDSSLSRVEVAASLEGAAAEGVDFTLASRDNERKFGGAAADGKVSFEPVPPGRWTICGAGEDVAIDEVKVVQASPSSIDRLGNFFAGRASASVIR